MDPIISLTFILWLIISTTSVLGGGLTFALLHARCGSTRAGRALAALAGILAGLLIFVGLAVTIR